MGKVVVEIDDALIHVALLECFHRPAGAGISTRRLPVMALSQMFLYVSGRAQGEINMNAEALRSRFVRPLARPLVRPLLAVLGLAVLAGPAPGHAEGFPFGRELLLDATPMRGSKKVPILDVGDAGTAEIELWCNSVKAQLVVAGDTITIITGETSARQCAPDRARADEDLLAALNDVTRWRMERSALVLTGSRTLRFRVPTN